MNSFTHNSKNSVLCVIPTVNEIKIKSDNNKIKTTEKDFSKISLTTKCYKCQGYRYIAANCPNLFKIVINDGVPIEAHKPIISLKVTHMVKEFIVIRPFSSLALLTPLSPPSLLLTPTVVTYFGHQSLSPPLLTPSIFLLWFILSTKSKSSTDLIHIAVNIKLLSLHHHLYHLLPHTCMNNSRRSVIKLHETMPTMGYELMMGIDKILLILVMLFKSCMLVVLIHFKS